MKRGRLYNLTPIHTGVKRGCPQVSKIIPTNAPTTVHKHYKLAVQNLPWAVQLAMKERYLQIWSLPTVLHCKLAVQNSQQIWYKTFSKLPKKCSKISKSKPPLALIPCWNSEVLWGCHLRSVLDLSMALSFNCMVVFFCCFRTANSHPTFCSMFYRLSALLRCPCKCFLISMLAHAI